MIPSLSAGVVGSRFVSQNEIETAKARRDEQWKAAYARCYIVSRNLFSYMVTEHCVSDLAKNHPRSPLRILMTAEVWQK
jgi:hypothetical protein